MNRRGFLKGLGLALVAAPAAVKALSDEPKPEPPSHLNPALHEELWDALPKPVLHMQMYPTIIDYLPNDQSFTDYYTIKMGEIKAMAIDESIEHYLIDKALTQANNVRRLRQIPSPFSVMENI